MLEEDFIQKLLEDGHEIPIFRRIPTFSNLLWISRNLNITNENHRKILCDFINNKRRKL